MKNLVFPNKLNLVLILILIISLINLIFNIQSITQSKQEAAQPPRTSGGGVIPQVADSARETLDATESGEILGSVDENGELLSDEERLELSLSSFLKTDQPVTCSWPEVTNYIVAGSLLSDRQLITLATADLSRTSKLLKTNLVIYLWETEQSQGYRFSPNDLGMAYEYLQSNQVNPDYITLIDLITSDKAPTCQEAEIDEKNLALPPLVNFKQIPAE